jgi:capsule polysaccharide export protein KpsE/RkpR
MAISTDDSRLGRLEGQMEQVAIMLQDMRAEIRALNARIDQLNTRIDRLTLAILGIGGGVIVALISLVGVLAARITQSG